MSPARGPGASGKAFGTWRIHRGGGGGGGGGGRGGGGGGGGGGGVDDGILQRGEVSLKARARARVDGLSPALPLLQLRRGHSLRLVQVSQEVQHRGLFICGLVEDRCNRTLHQLCGGIRGNMVAAAAASASASVLDLGLGLVLDVGVQICGVPDDPQSPLVSTDRGGSGAPPSRAHSAQLR